MSDIGILLACCDIVNIVNYNIIVASDTVKVHKTSIMIPHDRYPQKSDIRLIVDLQRS